jgi:hypothetical protein
MTANLTQTEIAARHHVRAVRFFWCFLIGATLVSLVGNVVHALLPYIPKVVIQIGAAAVPPIVLLAAVHGIALAVRAGASGRIYHWAIAAVAVVGAGAFMLSFRALRDLVIQTGTPPAWAWIFPAVIVEQFVIVDRIGSTLELVPHLVGSNRRPTGQRGALLWFRTGSNVVVPQAFRLLNIATTA